MKENIYIPISKGAGYFIKGDRVKWCDGLEGTVLGVCGNLITIETDDGVTRLADENYLDLSDLE